MKPTKKFAVLALSAVLTGPSFAFAAPVAALTPQDIPPEAAQAIDTVNHAVENTEVPLFDSRVLSIGLGALAGVLIYNLLPGTSLVSRAVPGAVGRAVTSVGATAAARTVATSQFPAMTSAVVGALVGDYVYRKNNRMPSVSAEIAKRLSP
jgi:uncharacterized membrane protein YeaQ/YmgE (transglycosylase-associated protein family)